jgi:hypothetical protein
MFTGTRTPKFSLKSEIYNVLMFIYKTSIVVSNEHYRQHDFIQCIYTQQALPAEGIINDMKIFILKYLLIFNVTHVL